MIFSNISGGRGGEEGAGAQLRVTRTRMRATIDVHHFYFLRLLPHLTSSRHTLKTDLEQKRNCYRMKNTIWPSYTNKKLREKK